MTIPTGRSFPTEVWPTTRTAASLLLLHASEYLKSVAPCYLIGRPSVIDHGEYADTKAAQLLEAKGDLIIAEVRIESWTADLGFHGCQVEG